jgi:molybdenum cofactor biosynthesis enzyme MoaA
MDVGDDQRLAARRRGAGGGDRRADRRRAAARAGAARLPRRGRQPLALPDGGGEIGIITSVTRPFCGDCTRARLSAEGTLYTCLFATAGTDLKAPLRAGATDDDLRALLAGVWSARDDRYSEERSAATAALPRREMSYLGG